jgi:hypothetical protein
MDARAVKGVGKKEERYQEVSGYLHTQAVLHDVHWISGLLGPSSSLDVGAKA